MKAHLLSTALAATATCLSPTPSAVPSPTITQLAKRDVTTTITGHKGMIPRTDSFLGTVWIYTPAPEFPYIKDTITDFATLRNGETFTWKEYYTHWTTIDNMPHEIVEPSPITTERDHGHTTIISTIGWDMWGTRSTHELTVWIFTPFSRVYPTATLTLGIASDATPWTSYYDGEKFDTVIIGEPLTAQPLPPYTTPSRASIPSDFTNTLPTLTITEILPPGWPAFTTTEVGLETDIIHIGLAGTGTGPFHTFIPPTGLPPTKEWAAPVPQTTVTTTIPYDQKGWTSTSVGLETDTVVVGVPDPTPHAYPPAAALRPTGEDMWRVPLVTTTMTLSVGEASFTRTQWGLGTDTVIVGVPEPTEAEKHHKSKHHETTKAKRSTSPTLEARAVNITSQEPKPKTAGFMREPSTFSRSTLARSIEWYLYGPVSRAAETGGSKDELSTVVQSTLTKKVGR
ncbi:hypothetical protein EJ06DRAFT_528124 [Trichodelitschia bisporula]|uniref:Uncharacterized protein n=1 Tax=Trichodelitschia bisporula TaxID=703511 RepID=A0A6G1I4H2_9PEZI|nr:hypothetical protein EJ06DRAFT_528124 [Trichodelitschia bisporula]